MSEIDRYRGWAIWWRATLASLPHLFDGATARALYATLDAADAAIAEARGEPPAPGTASATEQESR